MKATSVVFDGSQDSDPILVEMIELATSGAVGSKVSREINLTFPEGQADDIKLHVLDGNLVIEFVDDDGYEQQHRLAEV